MVVAVTVRLAMNVEAVFQAMFALLKVPTEVIEAVEMTDTVAVIYSMILTRSMWLHYVRVHQ